jgi:hypothetical protein
MANDYVSESGSTIITFFCGPNGKQFVQVNITMPNRTLAESMPLKKFLDFISPVLMEAARRAELEKKLERNK